MKEKFWILDHFPDHGAYVEPYSTGVSPVFFKKPVYLDVVNDESESLVNLYRNCKLNRQRLIEWLYATSEMKEKYTPLSIDEEIMKSTPLEWAKSTLSKITADIDNFMHNIRPFDIMLPENRTPEQVIDHIIDVLDNTQIDCIEPSKCINRYDDKDTLMYIHPPIVYDGTEEKTLLTALEKSIKNLLTSTQNMVSKLILVLPQHQFVENYASEKNYRIMQSADNQLVIFNF